MTVASTEGGIGFNYRKFVNVIQGKFEEEQEDDDDDDDSGGDDDDGDGDEAGVVDVNTSTEESAQGRSRKTSFVETVVITRYGKRENAGAVYVQRLIGKSTEELVRHPVQVSVNFAVP